MNDLVAVLSHQLARLPGIGERSAERLALYIVQQSRRYPGKHTLGHDLAEALLQAVEKIHFCQHCRYFTEEKLCTFCRNPHRNQRTILVVEQGSDVTGFEKAGIYSGLYFVLHGHLSPLKHVHPSDLGLELLLQRVKESTCEEVIFATSASIEGESTALYAAEQLRPLGVSLSRLAQGVPQGVGLECLDALTLGQAFCDRRAF